MSTNVKRQNNNNNNSHPKAIAQGGRTSGTPKGEEKRAVRKLVRKANKHIQREVESGRMASSSKPTRSQIERFSGNLVKVAKGEGKLDLSAISDFERIALSFAAPDFVPIQRWASIYSSGATATTSPFSIEDVGWNLDSRSGRDIPSTDCVCVMRGDPLLGAFVYDANTANEPCSYQMMLNGGDGDGSLENPATILTNVKVSTDAVPLTHAYSAPTTSYAPHGEMLFPGLMKSSPFTFVWKDGGQTITCMSNDTATYFLMIRVYVVTSGQICMLRELETAGTGADQSTLLVFSNDPTGYYAFTYHTPSGTRFVTSIGPITIGDTGAGHMCHRPMPYFVDNMASVDSMRVLAVACKLTNNAPTLYKSGKVVTYQLPQGVDWWDTIREKGFTGISKMQGAVTRTIEKGSYVWLKPTQPSDFNFQKSENFRGTTLFAAGFQIYPERAQIITYGRVDQVTGQSATWTLSYGAEYQTTDPWRTVEVPTMTVAVSNQALEFLKSMPQHAENPNHLGQLWDMVKDGAKWVVNNPEKAFEVAKKGVGFFSKVLA